MDVLNFNQFLHEQIATYSSQIGLPLDQAKFVFCLILAYPLALVYSFIGDKTLKHVVGMVIGVWFGWFTLEWQILHSFITSTVVYLIVLFLPRDVSHKVAFVFSLGYLAISHIYRMYVDYMGWSMDFTGIQMILTLKLITFAFDYSDGRYPVEKMDDYQKKMHLTRPPSVLEFYGYVYFFCGLLAGPAFNLREYLEYVNGALFKDAPQGKAPSSIGPTLYKLAQTALIMIPTQLGTMYLPLTWARTDAFITETTFLYRLLYIWFATTLVRFPYYFAWYLSEGSCILCGIGYSGYVNGVAKWERASNVKLIQLETAQNFKEVTDSWNIRTDKWLKNYVYKRVTFSPVMMTFLMSAFWHGFYPGYYLSFMTSAFIIEVARAIRRNIRSQFVTGEGKEEVAKPTKIIYDIICVFGTSFTLNYTMTAFVLLGFKESINVWKSVYFFGHILIVLGFIVAKAAGSLKKKPRREEKKQQ